MQLLLLKPAIVALLEPATEFVTLRPGPTGGLTVPLAALRLGWDLERRGLQMRIVNETQVQVTPDETLTLRDRAALHRWQSHVAVLLTYHPPEQ